MKVEDIRAKIAVVIDEYFDEAQWRDPYDVDAAIRDYRHVLLNEIMDVLVAGESDDDN